MDKLQMSGLALILSIFLAAVTQASYLPYLGSRQKRQTADVQAAEYLAWIALGGRIPHRGCPNIACGVVDVVTRLKRTGSDQRIAELQALIALAESGGKVAHGQFDPMAIGKRKRSGLIPENPENLTDSQRAVLVREILQKAQEEVDKTKQYSKLDNLVYASKRSKGRSNSERLKLKCTESSCCVMHMLDSNMMSFIYPSKLDHPGEDLLYLSCMESAS